MSISRITDKTPVDSRGRRWMSVDTWLKRYDQHRDPSGHYGTPGRDPQNIVTLKAAS